MMKKYFFTYFFLFPVSFLVISIQSCCSNKTVSAAEKNPASATYQKLPGTPSISPKMFRVNAILTNEPETGSQDQKKIYRLLIRDVLERGASLASPVAAGDTLTSEFSSPHEFPSSILKKGDEVIALIEERMNMNSDLPAFILRALHKK